jgi:subtilase family protein
LSSAPPYVTHLTNRLIKNPRVGYTWAAAPSFELSGWITDELLVSKDAPAAVKDRLKTVLGWQRVSSVLSKVPKKPGPKVVDIEIWKPAASNYAVVQAVLSDLTNHFGFLPKVSPNHLLVPCNLGCYCPATAPTEVAAQVQLAARIANFKPGKGPIEVAVIDTGYIPHPALERRKQAGGFRSVRGEVLNQNNNWVPSQPDGVLFTPDGRIQLLVGHGTFSAGVIAARCPRANVTLVGIRAVESAATEAAVAREIFKHSDADVIVPVFAFHTLHGIQNWTFQNVLPQLADGTVIVCPAGNESSNAPHYPAALSWPGYPVVGVGSFIPTLAPAGPNLSKFSDYGSWVFGYAAGQNVVGPYLKRRGRVEDGPAKALSFNGWARWSGTSFAAPKVAAAIVNRTPSSGLARGAVNQLRLAAQSVPLFGAAGASLGLDLRPLAK